MRASRAIILDAMNIPKLQIFCVSSITSDLRIFDTTANKFTLKMAILNFPSPVNCMHANLLENQLILGDMQGTVRILKFDNDFRDNFKSEGRVEHIQFSEISKVLCNKFNITFL